MVQIYPIEVGAEAQHKKCRKCSGSKTDCLEIIKCSYENCNKYCHVDCLPEEMREEVAELAEFFCDDNCKVALQNKQTFSVSKLMAEMERMKLENSETRKTSMEALQAINLLKSTIASLQDENRHLLAQNQSLSMISTTRAPASVDTGVFSSTAEEALFNVSSVQSSLKKVTQEINESLEASTIGNASTSAESNDPFHGKKFEAKGSAIVEHAKTSFLLSLKEIRKNLGELSEFDGKGSAWLKFKTRYNNIKVVGDYTNAEMVQKLEKALKGQALDYVQAWIDSPSPNAAKIITDLEERFFNVDTIMQEGLHKVAQIEKIKSWNREPLENYARAVDTYIHLCTTVDHSIHLNGRLPGEFEDKLPAELLREWLKHKSATIATGNWFEFSIFLKNSLKYLKVRSVDQQNSKDSKESKNKPVTTSKINVTVDTPSSASAKAPSSTSSTKNNSHNQRKPSQKQGSAENAARPFKPWVCEYDKCDKPLYGCVEFRKRKHDIKSKFCTDFNYCQRCLRKGHTAIYCRTRSYKCDVDGCTDPWTHSRVMHPDQPLKLNGHINLKDGFSLFQVVPVKIADKYGRKHDVTIFIDTGSNSSLITQDLYKKLGLDGTPYNFNIEWCAAGVKQSSKGSVKTQLNIFSLEKPDEEIILDNIVSMSNLQLPKQSQNSKELKKLFPHLSHVNIPDFDEQRPQILLGLQHRHVTFSQEIILPPESEVPIFAEHTPLGWVVCVVHEPGESVNFLSEASKEAEEETEEISLKQLHELVKFHINMDATHKLYEDRELLTANEKRALSVQQQTMKLVDRRYEVGFFWTSDDVELPNNYATAEKRLKSSEATLKKKGLVEWAVQHHKQLIELGFARETSKEDIFPSTPHKRINYVIGFVVVNNNKIPPKPRWVVDTACTHDGISLNSALLKGPDNLVPLTQALFHFRERKIAVVADVEKMFHQMKVNAQDQQCQRYLWRDCDPTKPPKTYIYTAMLFGPTDSPSKANAVRIIHAKNHAKKFPNASRAAIDSMYMDDIFNSEDEIAEAVKTAQHSIKMFDKICWKLVDFRSNSSEVLTQLPKERVNQNVMCELASDDPLMALYKVLGLHWKPKQDFFNFQQTSEMELLKKSLNENYRPNKREILSFVMRIYDCLGLISHFIVRGRMILQSVWKEKFDWDTEISNEVFNAWLLWLSKFDEISHLEIPRHYGYHSTKVTKTSLHVFTDASLDAYCGVCYFRFEFDDGLIKTCLVLSKCRVAPLKYLSIPKLELKGAVVGLQLAQVIREQHKRLNIASVKFWTDSEIVLKWIRGVHLKLQPFVAPRISEIRENSQISDWKHVPTKLNPADDGTKWNDIKFSDNNHRWFVGPEFLSLPEDCWPVEKIAQAAKAALAIRKIPVENPIYAGVFMEISPSIRANWNRYRLTIARVIRFCDNIKTTITGDEKNLSNVFNTDELNEAEIFILRNIQKAYWPDEYGIVSRGRQLVKNHSHSLHSLNPFLGPHGLLRSHTRMSHENAPFSMKFPIILPNKHETVNTIVRHYHEKNHHIGIETVVANLRSRYWIIHTRNAVKRISATCLYCIEMRAKPYSTPTAPLPSFRVTPTTKAFEFVGCDCFGPLEVYTRNSKRKRSIHVVIFTCLTSRAIYLRRLDAMSTDEMLLAIQELWTRRGPVKIIVSDNGKNFIGSANFLKREFLQRMANEFNVKWIFNPPYTPQWGGAWERLIRDIKRALKASMRGKIISEKEFDVVLLQIEDIINSRPLTHVPASPDDEFPISPNLLVKLHPGYPFIDSDIKLGSEEKDTRKMIKRSRDIVRQFMSRWVKEYLPIITRAPANGKGKSSIKEGDFVIYCDPTINPSKWQRGIVKIAHAGRDGIARVADIKLLSGEILEKRSAYRLAKLDIANDAFFPNLNDEPQEIVSANVILTNMCFKYAFRDKNDNLDDSSLYTPLNLSRFAAQLVTSSSSDKNIKSENVNLKSSRMQSRSEAISSSLTQAKVVDLLQALDEPIFINSTEIKDEGEPYERALYDANNSSYYYDPSNAYTVKLECHSTSVSFAEVIIALTSFKCQPNVIYITDTSMKLPVIVFVILANSDEALKLLALANLKLGEITARVLKRV